MSARVQRAWALAISLALLMFYATLAIAADHAADANRRTITLMSLGSETDSRAGNVSAVGDDLRIAAGTSSALATWNEHSYEIAHLTNHARSCTMSVALVGLALASATTRGSVEILVNGNVIRRSAFSKRLTGLYPFEATRLVPENLLPAVIELVPLDPEYGFVVPIPASYCSATGLSIGVRVADATWRISHAGVILAYTPAPMTPRSNWAWLLLGGTVVVALIVSSYLVVRRFAAIGVAPLVAATLLLALSPLTYDQWDFRLWLNFADVAVFGAGDPAYLWKGSPFWAFVPSLFSSITGACYVLTGHGSAAFTALSLKIAMGIAYCYSAYEIAMRAPLGARRLYALCALLLPVGLFELGAGYREVFAGAVVIASLVAASRNQLLFSTVLAATAAAISEALAPMVLLAATIALTGSAPLGRRLGYGAALATLGVALAAGQWFLLLPHDLAKTAFGYRFGAAHFGGASWAGALQHFDLLPRGLPAGAPLFGACVYGVLAIVPAVHCVRVLARCENLTRASTFDEIVAVFIALVAAFLLAFRGTDPNLWYAVTSVTLWYFARAKPSSPFPLLLGGITGIAFYATVGFREFVNQTYFWPVDRGLLGVLSTSRYVFVLMVNALLVASIATISRRSPLQLFSRRSPRFLIVFASVVAATAIGSDALDIVICFTVATCVITTFVASIGAQRRYRELDAVGRSPLGACDVVLGAGAIALLAVQPGSGIVSKLGWIALLSYLLAIVVETAIKRESFLPRNP